MNISGFNNMPGAILAPADSAAARPLTQEQRTLIQAVKAVNASELLGQENELTFILERGSRQPVIRIVNRETGEVVQQIPAEYVLRMAEEMKRG